MPDSILLTPDSRLLKGSGPADFAHYGAQPDPIVSFAPAPTDSPAIDPLGIARPAQGSGTPDEANAPVLLDQSLAFLPDAAAPLPSGSSASFPQSDASTPAVREVAAPVTDPVASPSPMSGGSLAPTPFLPILDEQSSSGSLANALSPSSLEPASIGSAVPLLDPIVSNVSALSQPVGSILNNLDDTLLTPVTGGVVAPLAEGVIAPVVSNVALPLVDGTADVLDGVVQPVDAVLTQTGNALESVTAAVGDTAQPAVAGLTGVVEPVLTGTTEAVAPAVGATADALAPAVTAVAATADDTLTPVAEAITPALGTASDTAQPLAGAAAPVTDPLAEAAGAITGPAVDAGIATLVDLVQAADMIAPTPAGAEPLLATEDTSGSIVDTLASPDPEDSLLGINSDDGSGADDGDNDDPLGFGG